MRRAALIHTFNGMDLPWTSRWRTIPGKGEEVPLRSMGDPEQHDLEFKGKGAARGPDKPGVWITSLSSWSSYILYGLINTSNGHSPATLKHNDGSGSPIGKHGTDYLAGL